MLFAAKLFKKIGPGFITGASDDDPSGIATYSQAGSQFGYRMLWLSLFTTPLMMAVQEMCARIGMTSGRGLMGVLKRHTSRRVVWFLSLLLLVANTVNIGADLGAMAEATRLILPGSTWLYLGLIAAGGMSEVHRALDRDLNRVVAMKVIRRDFAAEPALVARFVEEA
ncbi:MAG: divalent metal cation transporter, partial [Candidatus Kerfeldbacteria bacterium]|nr:divalent metal cation transporter [Candidatus Kerfeldbacteria bacterium]